MYELSIIVSFACVLALLVGACWGIYLLVRCVSRVPAYLHGHMIAPIIWSMITLGQTAILLGYRSTPNLFGHLVVLVAGWVMVSSWGQFAERRMGQPYRQNNRYLPRRLFVQTLWGPLALWLGVAVLSHVGEWFFEDALTQRDLPTVRLLQKYGIGDITNDKYGDRMVAAIETGDVAGLTTYLAAGVDPNFAFLYGEYPLHAAVKSGNVQQVQILLQNGAERKIYDADGKTAFQLAKELKQPAMIAALLSADTR